MTATARSPHQRTDRLPAGFEAWLLDCVPAPGCDICAANWRQLLACKQAGDMTRAMRHATEIRDHPSGVHEKP